MSDILPLSRQKEDVFLLLDQASHNLITKASPYWVYLEDEKGQPCPLPALYAYIQRHAKRQNESLRFFTCQRPKKHRRKHVINLRDFLCYAHHHLPLNDMVVKFLMRVILDVLAAESVVLDEELLTQLSMKLNELLTKNKEMQYVG